ncbi:ComEC/Rec2 family competence protein [Flavobacterium nitrogenifigens]|uniref:Competence protein ComEC n=1 Tax=Flavobacterium nitrogenifigens TaxID=1617283 RepID=A0A521CCX7_9FLAO|nr:ComEC/Rec2 family competence protein [Flavobacterium nitrogenifigens]KAF2327098.1 ComEC/Rec2 family competence protein [Flavobacterium nitrogenifigens]SMO57276.1 competence protein ComEC [Flavobacterium nitrogenifigens]
MKVLDFPLVKITSAFVLGIIASYYLHFSITLIVLLTSIGFIIFSGAFIWNLKRNKKTILFGSFSYILSFCIGALTLLCHTQSLQKSNYTHCQTAFKNPQSVTLILREKLKSNDYSDRYIGLVKTISEKSYSGKIIVNVQKDSTKAPLIVGNSIKIQTILQQNKPSKNPNQFDYGRYLADKQIYAQIYCQKKDILVSKTIQKDIWYYCAQLHSRIISNLEKSNFNKDEMNVALALILGQQQEISQDIIQDYQYSGATHILSVSGLHVGFIMLFITFILKPIPNTRKGSFFKLASILISLAGFAIISGLSPSVLRSVVMFSFVAIGSHLRRNGNIYHTLLVSILLILLFEPYFLFDVGFQLSYIALFFILWLHPILKNIYKPKNKLTVYIWEALTVSFAAQIGTLPLCLYYFHQFPGLFFVTNIIILPVLSFIMIAGIVVMIVAIFTSPPLFMTMIFEKSIYLLNLMIHAVASVDSFVIRDISFNFYHLWAFSFFIIGTIIWIKKPSFNKLILVFASIIFIQISFILTKVETENKEELIVYNEKNNTLISERLGSHITLYTRDTIQKDINTRNINSYLVGNSIRLTKIQEIKNVLYFKNNKILIIDSTKAFSEKIQPDILVLTQTSKINLDRVLKNIHPKIVIADGSNSNSIQKYWKKSCLKKNIPFHSTKEKGYYQF